MPRRARTLPAIVIIALACIGLASYAATRDAGPAEPADQATHTEQSPEAQAITTWLKSLPLPGLPSQLPEAGLSEYQARALSALKAEPDFEQFLNEVPNIGRLYFSRYFAWQIRNIRSEEAADGPLFVHTIMNDLARLKTFSEERIIEIRLERERQYGLLLQPVRDRLKQELLAHDLPQATVDSVMETFERSAADTRNYLTNPACAMCDLPADAETVHRMRRYQEENLSTVAHRIEQTMRRPTGKNWKLASLKFAAAMIEQKVASDFIGRAAWRDKIEIERPGMLTERTLQPGPYHIFFPVEWDRFSYWRATGGRSLSGGSSSGGVDNPEPHRTVILRYRPDEDHPDRERYESAHDQVNEI